MQLPCVGVSLWKALLAPPGDANVEVMAGAALFKQFQVYQLTQQMRAAGDSLHQTHLQTIRSLLPRRFSPSLRDVVERLVPLSVDDVIRDPLWADPAEVRVLVTSNRLRARLNRALAVEYARQRNRLVIAWRLPFTPETLERLQRGSRGQTTEQFLREEFAELIPELTVHFVEGAPCQVLANFNPGRGVANGTSGYFHSLCLDEASTACVEDALARNLAPGTVVLLPSHPLAVNVDMVKPGSLVDSLRPEVRDVLEPLSVVPGRVVISIAALSPRLTSRVGRPPAGFSKSDLLFREAAVDTLFACTTWKAQSLTLLRVIAHMAAGMLPRATLAIFYTNISRTPAAAGFRLMTGDKEHLWRLRHPPEMLDWSDGVGDQPGARFEEQRLHEVREARAAEVVAVRAVQKAGRAAARARGLPVASSES